LISEKPRSDVISMSSVTPEIVNWTLSSQQLIVPFAPYFISICCLNTIQSFFTPADFAPCRS